MVLAVLFKPLTPGLLQQCWAGYGKGAGVLGPSIPDPPAHTFPVTGRLPATALSPFPVPWPQFNNLNKHYFWSIPIFLLPPLIPITLLTMSNLALILLSSRAPLLLAFAVLDNSWNIFFHLDQELSSDKSQGWTLATLFSSGDRKVWQPFWEVHHKQGLACMGYNQDSWTWIKVIAEEEGFAFMNKSLSG